MAPRSGVLELFKGEGGISRWGQQSPRVGEEHVWMMVWRPERAGLPGVLGSAG